MTESDNGESLLPPGRGNAKFNATTHGIFCGVVVLKGESLLL